jgi:hypothetical protein
MCVRELEVGVAATRRWLSSSKGAESAGAARSMAAAGTGGPLLRNVRQLSCDSKTCIANNVLSKRAGNASLPRFVKRSSPRVRRSRHGNNPRDEYSPGTPRRLGNLPELRR